MTSVAENENITMNILSSALSFEDKFSFCEAKTPNVVSTEIPQNQPDVITVPKFVFIIPYRNRAFYLQSFIKKMSYVLEDIPKTDYEVYVIHQNDTRKFNRGAIKNIGFLYIKNKYPNDYKQMTLVFNDVDIFPLRKNYVNYVTTKGIVKHFFGFGYTLGGIVSIVGEDFERINGFPNFWAWGYEDNLIQTRIKNAGIQIDRSNFYDLSINNDDGSLFACINSGIKRITSKNEYIRYLKQTHEGFNCISGIQLSETLNQIPPHIVISNTVESELPVQFKNNDSGSIHANTNNILNRIPEDDSLLSIDFITINVNHFVTEFPENSILTEVYDLRNGAVPYKGVVNNKRNPKMYMEF